MKIKYLKLKNWLLAAIAPVLGMQTSCIFGGADEYGTPEADYKVKGMVTDVDGHPVPGINVSMFYAETTTDNDGRYEVGVRNLGIDTAYVSFRDVDGADNGRFADTVGAVSFRDAHFEGGHGWYEGEATKTLDMTLRTLSEE